MSSTTFARETTAIALIGAVGLAIVITTEDSMPKPFALYQAKTMAGFTEEPRNAIQVHAGLAAVVAETESAVRAERLGFGARGERTCCDGKCLQRKGICPADGWNPLHSNAVQAPARKPSPMQRLRAWWHRHVVDHRIWE